jgi:hypothetical protein
VGPFSFSIERRALALHGKAWEHKVVYIDIGRCLSVLILSAWQVLISQDERGETFVHDVLQERPKHGAAESFHKLTDPLGRFVTYKIKIVHEFCKAGAKNLWTSQIRGGGVLRFRLATSQAQLSPELAYSYKTCTAPDCSKEARRGSDFCKVHGTGAPLLPVCPAENIF